MTIRQEEIEYYRSKIIDKYVTPIMDKYANEEIEYKKEVERIERMLKNAKR